MLDAYVERKEFGNVPLFSKKTVDIVKEKTEVQLPVCSDLGKKILGLSKYILDQPRNELKEEFTKIQDRLNLAEGESCSNKTLLLLGTIAAVIFVAGVIILGALGGVSPFLLAAFGLLSVLVTNFAAGALTFLADLEYELINGNDLNPLGILSYGIISAFASVFTRVSRLQSQIYEKSDKYNLLNKAIAVGQDQIQQYLDQLKGFMEGDRYKVVADYLEMKGKEFFAEIRRNLNCEVSAETSACGSAQSELESAARYFQKQKEVESSEKKSR